MTAAPGQRPARRYDAFPAQRCTRGSLTSWCGKDDGVADESMTIELGRSELREVAGYAAACARPALAIFERELPGDRRPRAAVEAAQAFADGGEPTKALRDSAWAAHRAAQEARDAGHA